MQVWVAYDSLAENGMPIQTDMHVWVPTDGAVQVNITTGISIQVSNKRSKEIVLYFATILIFKT